MAGAAGAGERAGELGVKVRALREREGLSQAALAKRLGISASYLNLIEHGRRPLTAPLLLELARQFALDLEAFAGDRAEGQLLTDLREAFGDALHEEQPVRMAEVRELVARAPTVARAVARLYRAYRGARDALETLGERVRGAPGLLDEEGRPAIPSEEVSDLLQREGNHLPALEAAAEETWRAGALRPDDLTRGLMDHLERAHGVRARVVAPAALGPAIRRWDPARREVLVSAALPRAARRFQLAHALALVAHGPLLDRLCDDPALTGDESRRLARAALANYFAAAVVMPYEATLEAARAERYDVERLQARFGASFEQVCHRLTTLARPGQEGVPWHFVRVDVAGNISKRFTASGIRISRFGGACPRWNVHAAFLTPGLLRVQLSRMPDGTGYFCFARTVRKPRDGYHAPETVYAIGMGCPLARAREVVYSDGLDLGDPRGYVPIGVTCRICERTDCAQRAFPPLQERLRLDPNVRGASLYVAVDEPGP